MGQAALKTTLDSINHYHPYTKLIGEPRDLTGLMNLARWSTELCTAFADKIKPQLDTNAQQSDELVDNMALDGLFNNYTFILAYQGHSKQSRAALMQIIGFWADKYRDSGDIRYLRKTVQPTINLARLHRMTGNQGAFWQVFNQYSCLTDSHSITLGGHTVSKALLGEGGDNSEEQTVPFLQRVSFWEILKTHLADGDFDKVLALGQSQPDHLIKTKVYREAQIIALLSLQQYNEAKSIIRGAMFKTNGIQQSMFYYRLYEYYQCLNQTQQASNILDDIIAEVTEMPLSSLEELLFASKLIEEAKLPADAQLSINVIEQYQQVGDELNYGKLLLNLYKNRPDETLKTQLLTLADNTGYPILQQAIARQFKQQTTHSIAPATIELGALFSSIFV